MVARAAAGRADPATGSDRGTDQGARPAAAPAGADGDRATRRLPGRRDRRPQPGDDDRHRAVAATGHDRTAQPPHHLDPPGRDGDRGRLADDREKLLGLRDALELLYAAAHERESTAGNEVAHGAGDEHLPGTRQAGDPVGDVHGDAADFRTTTFDLTGVQTGAQLDPPLRGRLHDRLRAPDGTRRAVEGGEEPVTGPAHLIAAVDGELTAYHLVMNIECGAPLPVTGS